MKSTLKSLKNTKEGFRDEFWKAVNKVRIKFKKKRLAAKGDDPFNDVKGMSDKECYQYYADV